MKSISSSQYRADIDGLRAVAVLSVLINHFVPEFLPGGFTGVDIFFVISGFLITGILLKESRMGVISVTDFYVRRAKRILPSFVALLVTVLLAGWFFLFTPEFSALGKHIFSGAFFFPNFGYYFENGYFARESSLKPLLHLWSLGIEEQFYFVWPWILIVFLKRLRQWTWLLICIFFVASFALNVHATYSDSGKAFYLPVYRAWELLSGALLAFAIENGKQLKSRNWTALAGLVLILIPFVFLNSNRHFPGVWALMPTMGAVALIASGPSGFINRYVLSQRIFVWIGLISYPLYLWHWPILVFLRLFNPEGVSLIIKLIFMLASVFFAWVTYLYVERPVRSTKSQVLMPVALVVATLVLGLLGFAVYQFQPSTRLKSVELTVTEADKDWTFPENLNWKKKSEFTTHEIGNTQEQSVLLIGDSHIEQYWSRAQVLSKLTSKRFVFATFPGCPALPEIDLSEEGSFACDAFSRYAFGLAQDPHFDIVVLGGFWEKIFGLAPGGDGVTKAYSTRTQDHSPLTPNSPEFKFVLDDFGQAIGNLVKKGKKVVVILTIPTSPAFKPENLYSRISGSMIGRAIKRNDVTEKSELFINSIAKVALASGASVINPMNFLCPQGICQVVNADGVPIYKDDNHLRSSFVRENATYFDAILN